MLGNDDIDVLIDEPISAADLFGEDEGEVQEIPPLSPNADQGEDDAAGGAGADAEGAPKKIKRIVNRLANLNEKWVTDPNKEGMYTVNKYFEDIKIKHVKGNELESLKLILRRYEYWAQQCYPKFCFTDVVDKLEYLSGKKMIKGALMDIRSKTSPLLDVDIDDDGNPALTVPIDASGQDNLNVFPIVSPPISHPPTQVFNSFSSPQPDTSSSVIGDDMKEIIRRKREEAMAKRKRKLEESLNSSSVSIARSDNADRGADGQGNDLDATLNSSTISIPQLDNAGERSHSQGSEVGAALNSSFISEPRCNDTVDSNGQETVISTDRNKKPELDEESYISHDMKEIIRRKREEAMAKRKRKLEESLNSSSISISHSSNADGDADDQGSDLDATLNSSTISVPQLDNNVERSHSQRSGADQNSAPQCNDNITDKTNELEIDVIATDLSHSNKETEMDEKLCITSADEGTKNKETLSSVAVSRSNDLDDKQTLQGSRLESPPSVNSISQSDGTDRKTNNQESEIPSDLVQNNEETEMDMDVQQP